MRKRTFCGMILVFSILACLLYQERSYAGKSVDKKIEKAQKESKSLSKKSGKYAEKADKAQKKQDDMMKEIEKLDKKIEKAETEMDLVDQQIKAKEEELKKEQASLEEATQNAQIQYDTMKKRIKYMYENGNQDYIDILFSSKSIADLLNNAEYVDKISEYDRSMFANYKKTWDEVNTRKAAVESMIETLKSKKLEQKEDKYDLELLRKNKKKQMKQFEQSQKKNQKKANELAKEAAKAENEVNRLLAQKQAEIDGSDSGIVFSGGALSWPLKVSGRISSKFGHRSSPTAGASTYHKGLDIAVPSGTPILAAAAGKVVTAHYSSSTGNYIMIAHGNRLYTVYMHCSRLAVKEGDSVVQGQTIGYAGSTGISTGSHLHFGVSKNGSYVNPLNYVSR